MASPRLVLYASTRFRKHHTIAACSIRLCMPLASPHTVFAAIIISPSVNAAINGVFVGVGITATSGGKYSCGCNVVSSDSGFSSTALASSRLINRHIITISPMHTIANIVQPIRWRFFRLIGIGCLDITQYHCDSSTTSRQREHSLHGYYRNQNKHPNYVISNHFFFLFPL